MPPEQTEIIDCLAMRLFRKGIVAIIVSGLLMGALPLPASADDLYELQELVDEARLVFETFFRHPDMGWLRDHLKDAKGLFIMPGLTEGGYILGASHARGVFLVRDEQTNRWSEPAFYRVVGGSLGLQIGISTSKAIVLVMTDKGKESLLGTTFIFGPALTVAAGPVGRSVGAGVSSQLAADFITYARAKGAIISLSLGGTVVAVRDRAHETYYGQPVEPPQILLNDEIRNWYSSRLRKALTLATGGKWER